MLNFTLWNPVTREFIVLPALKLETDDCYVNNPYMHHRSNTDDIVAFCLSSSPSSPDSVVIFTRCTKRHIVFCRLRSKEKQWIELSYVDQIRNILDCAVNDDIYSMFGCNGNVYAVTQDNYLVQVVVNDKDGIHVLPFGVIPGCQLHCSVSYLTGNSNELFTIVVCHNDYKLKQMQATKLFKLDFSRQTWVELKRARDRVFFLAQHSMSKVSCLTTQSKSGSYIHFIGNLCQVYSYNMEDKTISLSSLPCPDLPLGLW